MKCPYCHQEVADGDMFCGECGNRLPHSPHSSSGNKIILCSIVGVIAAILIAVLLFFVIGRQKDTERDETDVRTERTGESRISERAKPEKEKEEEESADQEEESSSTVVNQKEEVSPADIKVSYMDAGPSEAFRIQPVSASSSSELEQENTDSNSAWAAMDQKSETSWQEGVKGSGIGESLRFTFGEEKKVRYLSFQLGNWRDTRYAEGNNRPKTLNIRLGNSGFNFNVEFPKEQKVYWLQLSEAYPADEIEITIQDVYKGTSWDDTCIAEIGVYEGWD